MTTRKMAVVIALWVFIAVVAAYDVYVTIRYAPDIMQRELNPLGQKLLMLNAGHPAGMLTAKWAGSLVVMLTLILSSRRYPRACWAATVAVAVVQAVVVIVLNT